MRTKLSISGALTTLRRSAVMFVAVVIATSLWQPKPAHAGKLKQLRKETRTNSSSSNSSGSDGYSDSGSGGGDPVLAFYVLTSPWWLPFYATGDAYGRTWAFAEHPYAHSQGYAQFAGVSRPRNVGAGRQLLGQSAALRLRAEGGVLTSDGPFDSNLQRVTLGARLSTNFRLELGTEWTLWSEQLVGGMDQLWLGKLEATILFAQSERVQFRSGLGFRFLVDEEGTVPGMNFIYGMDIYPFNPLILSVQADIGNVGAALATQLRASAGILIHGVELFVAYDRLAVNDLVFGGPTVGIRSWH